MNMFYINHLKYFILIYDHWNMNINLYYILLFYYNVWISWTFHALNIL